MSLRFVLILGLVAGTASGLAAQERDCHCGGLREVRHSNFNPNRRQGFWASLGAGGGAESFDANNGLGWSHDTWGGLVFGKAGFTVSQAFTVAAEGDLWLRDYPDSRRNLGSLMIVGQIYPAPRGAFFLKGGAGWTRDETDQFFAPGATHTHENGWGFVAGLGYDARVARGVSITPSLDFVGHRYATHDERMLNVGVAITIH